MINIQIQELNKCFTEINTKLLLWITWVLINKILLRFLIDIDKLLCFVTFYLADFSSLDIIMLTTNYNLYLLSSTENDKSVI